MCLILSRWRGPEQHSNTSFTLGDAGRDLSCDRSFFNFHFFISVSHSLLCPCSNLFHEICDGVTIASIRYAANKTYLASDGVMLTFSSMIRLTRKQILRTEIELDRLDNFTL